MTIEQYITGVVTDISSKNQNRTIPPVTVGDYFIDLALILSATSLTGLTVDLSDYYTMEQSNALFLSAITSTEIDTALGYTPIPSSSTLSGYFITSGDTLFDDKYQPIGNYLSASTLSDYYTIEEADALFLTGITSSEIDTALGYSPLSPSQAILNQNGSAQTASFFINNTGQINGQFTVGGSPANVTGYQSGVQYMPTGTNGGIYSAGVYQTIASPITNTTSSFYGLSAQGTTNTNSHNFNMIGAYSASIALRGSSTINLALSYNALSPFFNATGGVTTSTGLYILPQKVIGVNTGYGIYQLGNQDYNYFNGVIGIQTVNPTANLQVNQNTTGPGAVIITSGTNTITGFQTSFLNTFITGQTISVSGETHVINSITSNTGLTTVTNWINNSYLPIPQLLSLSPNLNIGSLTAGTYYYVITALSNLGETLASNEISLTLLTTGSIQIGWQSIIGAVSYNIYRGTSSSGETQYINTTNYQNFLDNGTLSFISGTPPVTNTAIGAAPYSVSGGTLFQVFGNGKIYSSSLVPSSMVMTDSNNFLISASSGFTSEYKMVPSYSGMTADGTPATLIKYKVLADEHKSLTNTLYEWWPDGKRIYLTTTTDN